MTTTDQLRRWAYLHEAGHALVAVKVGLRVTSVECNGEEGGCKFELPSHVKAKIAKIERRWDAGAIDAHADSAYLARLWQRWLTALLGGIAGEGVHGSDAVTATVRARDDLPAFFGIVRGFTAHLPTKDAFELSSAVYTRAHETAVLVAREGKDLIGQIADGLEEAGHLSESDLHQLLR